MPCITLPYDPAVGPLFAVGVAQPLSSLADPSSAQKITWFRGLIDTGCSNLSIAPAAAKTVGLPIIGKQPVASTTQTIDSDLFLGDLFIPFADPADKFHHFFRDVRFLEFRFGNVAFDILIGRDVLSLGLFQLNGKTNQFTFAW
jgi:hypothetical protein